MSQVFPHSELRTLGLALCLALVACSNQPGTIEDGSTTDAKIDTQNSDLSFGQDTLKDANDAVSDAVDASGDATIAVMPGEFSAPCKDETDCNSGICVQAYSGKMCSTDCNSAECPAGFSCQQVMSSGQDQIYACVPKFKHLCEPCAENKDCNDGGESTNVCISFADTGSFCGAVCDPTSSDCPAGYQCQTVVNPATGAKVSQCRHQGICDCSSKATTLGLSTKCWVKNEYGKCDGVRQCGAEGLSECSAGVPATEECNGIDDDCNGQTDDISVSNSVCKIPLNSFNVAGKYCYGKLIACINGVAKCDGAAATVETCNGLDDNCDGQTDEGLCEDGDPCTKDSCTPGSTSECTHIQLAGMACDDANICTQTDKCLAGTCVGGNSLNCDDNDPCTTDSCDPFTGCKHLVASDAACASDGKDCTLDTCKNGTCQHIVTDSLPCQSDGEQCTDDTCMAGVCKHVNSAKPCDDGNSCTVGDLCSGGKCLSGKTPSCDDGNPCTTDTCDPNTVDGCQHSNNDFAACASTSTECPVGICAGGVCSPKPNTTCQTTVKSSICTSDPIAGVCTASGKCVVTKPPTQYTCPGCNGICLNCAPFGQICIPLTTP